MKRIGVAMVTGMLMASPVAADWTDADAVELRALVAAFRAGEDVDGTRLAELAGSAAETGIIQTGLFEGALAPIAAPVTLMAVPRARLDCVTNVVSEIPLPGFPPQYEEVSALTRNGVNDGGILYETTDPESVLRMGASWNDAGFKWQEIYMDDQFGEIRLRPQEDGSLLDEVTGDVFSAQGEEAQFLNGLVDAVSSVNPWWFLMETQAQAGDAWLDPDSEGDLIEALRSMISTSLGIPGAAMTENLMFTAITGVTDRDGAETIVFEILLDVDVDAPDVGQMNMRIAAVEFYDVATFTRVGMDNEMRVSAPGFGFEMTQDQGCSVTAG